MATIRWTLRAQLDLRDIRNFVARSSPQNGLAITAYLLHAVSRLEDFPMSGRIVPEFERSDLREVIAQPFRILYIVRQGDVIEIQAVYRSSRNLRRIIENDPLN